MLTDDKSELRFGGWLGERKSRRHRSTRGFVSQISVMAHYTQRELPEPLFKRVKLII